MKCLIWIKKTKRFREFSIWNVHLGFNFFVFCIYWHTLIPHLKKKLNLIFSVANIFFSFHTFSTPRHFSISFTSRFLFLHQYLKVNDLFPRLFFHRIAFIIYRLPFLGTNIFCIICLKTSHLSLVVKLLFVVVILLNWWQTKLLDSYGKADCFGQGEKAPKWECLYLPKDILNITICFSDRVPGKQLDSYQWCFLLVVMDISKINIVLCFLFQSTYVCVKS